MGGTAQAVRRLGVLRSGGVPCRVGAPVSARSCPLEAAVDRGCGLGGYERKNSQAVDGSWEVGEPQGRAGCLPAHTQMTGDRQERDTAPPSTQVRLPAGRQKGPLPALTFRVNFVDSTDLPFWSAEQCKQSR